MADHGPIEVWFSTGMLSAVYMLRVERHPDVEPNEARDYIQTGVFSLRHPIKGWRRLRRAWAKVNTYIRAVKRQEEPT